MSSTTVHKASLPGQIANPPLVGGEAKSAVDRPEGAAPLLHRLSHAEMRRRIWHMFPGLLPIASWAYPHEDPLSPTFKWIAVTLIVGLGITVFLKFSSFVRKNETGRLGSVVGYAASVLLTLLLFPAHAELGMTVLVILAFGDGSATLAGLALGGPTLPWNPRKTWAGLLSFLAVGGPLAVLAYWAESQPHSTLVVALACGMTATIVAGIAESLPSRLNDNIRVGLAAAVTVVAIHSLTVGLVIL